MDGCALGRCRGRPEQEQMSSGWLDSSVLGGDTGTWILAWASVTVQAARASSLQGPSQRGPPKILNSASGKAIPRASFGETWHGEGHGLNHPRDPIAGGCHQHLKGSLLWRPSQVGSVLQERQPAGRNRTECPSHPGCQVVDARLAFVLLRATNVLQSM